MGETLFTVTVHFERSGECVTAPRMPFEDALRFLGTLDSVCEAPGDGLLYEAENYGDAFRYVPTRSGSFANITVWTTG
jgi:hypothetical protein